MNTINLDSTIAKLFKNHGFRGEVKTRIESQFEDSDWIFLAKTIRNEFKNGRVTYVPEELRDRVITLLILSRISDVNETYKYSDHKDVLKGLHVIPALWSSFVSSDSQFLYRRALESICIALALVDGSDLSASGWQDNIEVAALCLLAILQIDSDMDTVAKKAPKKAKVKVKEGTEEFAAAMGQPSKTFTEHGPGSLRIRTCKSSGDCDSHDDDAHQVSLGSAEKMRDRQGD